MLREETNAALAWALPQTIPARTAQPKRRAVTPRRRAKPRQRAARALAWLTVAVTALGTGLAYGYLWLQAAQVQATRELGSWQQQLALEQQRVDEVRQEVLQLASPAHIEGVARQQLGMVDEPQVQLVLPGEPAPSRAERG